MFTMSLDIAGPFEKGVDSDAKTRQKYLLVATYAVPLMKDGEFIWTEHKDAPIPDCAEFLDGIEELPEPTVDPLPEHGEPERMSRAQEYINTISQPLRTKTLVLCEPVPSRKQQDVRLAAMRLYVKLVNAGFPVHRVHSDRARELVSAPLQSWFTEHGVALTTTIGEEPAANGRAEVGIQIVKSQVRRMMKAGSIPVKFWPAVARHASERIWRDSLDCLGVPQPTLLACGTVVRARPRSWVDRSNPWRDRMVEGKILSVAPNCAHGYAVLLPDESILLSSTVVAAPTNLVSKPPHGWEKKQPTHRVRGKKQLKWVTVSPSDAKRARFSPRGESSAASASEASGARVKVQGMTDETQQQRSVVEVKGSASSQPPDFPLPSASSQPPDFPLPSASSQPPDFPLPSASSQPPDFPLPSASSQPPDFPLPSASSQPDFHLPSVCSQPKLSDSQVPVCQPGNSRSQGQANAEPCAEGSRSGPAKMSVASGARMLVCHGCGSPVSVRMLRVVPRMGIQIPPWPHPPMDEALTLRYLWQCEPLRLIWYLGETEPEIGILREVSGGTRLSVAAAWFRWRPPHVWQALRAEEDSNATSSSDGITPPETMSSLSGDREATTEEQVLLAEGRDHLERGELSQLESLSLSQPEIPELSSAGRSGLSLRTAGESWADVESSSDSAQSVEEEYFRVHMFHSWDENYRPEVVRQRVEAWRSRGLRQGRDPDIHGLSGTENASVQMMVGYFRYERPRSSHSSTPSPPVLRVILASPEVSHEPLSYLQPIPSAQGLRAAALSAEVPSGDQANLVSGSEAEDLESLGAWEVEMPEMETTTELVEEASQEHYAVSMSVRRLRHDLEGMPSQDPLRFEKVRLIEAQRKKGPAGGLAVRGAYRVCLECPRPVR